MIKIVSVAITVFLLSASGALAQDVSYETEIKLTPNYAVSGSAQPIAIRVRTEWDHAAGPTGLKVHELPTLSIAVGQSSLDTSVALLTAVDRQRLEQLIKAATDSLNAKMKAQSEKIEAMQRDLHDKLLSRIAALPVELAKDDQAYKLLRLRLITDLNDTFQPKSKN
ncbi:MAG TPA: hypothetical protein VMT72_09375 [Pseudolabrys sp.]|nr:hypothetical protein [Pseudolabrys sp.]